MRKSVISKHTQGSAEEVVAHAKWRHSRGRNPSMSFVGERNPRKALSLAEAVIAGAKHADFISKLGELAIRHKSSYAEMTDAEIEAAARYIITSSSSATEAQQRLRDELGYPYGIALHITLPDDATGREARELMRGLGGLVMKNGAMAMAMMHGHDGTIDL